MNISIISAVANNNVIGKDNQLLWHLSDDLKRFKSLTFNHIVIMGQKTYESIGKPLPHRTNIVISNDYDFKLNIPPMKMDDCDIRIVHSIESALETAEVLNDINDEYEVFVIGGGSIYREFMKYANRLYITKIYKDFEGDTYFPEIDPSVWKPFSFSEIQYDDECQFNYQYWTYEKI